MARVLTDAERIEIAVAALHGEPTTAANNGTPDDDDPYLQVETWRQFEAKALDRVPVLVDRLWPEAAFGFIAAPPKKGKTWVALSLALSVATGQPFLGQFTIPQPRPVLYVALEGHRAGLRARVGALTHGLGANPDTHDLRNLHWLYKPLGLNLADPTWARLLLIAAIETDAALVIVDVLRASARLKENDQEAFGMLRYNLQPILDGGRSIAMLHHFGKLTETQKERDPGERMSGSGAMFGALDTAVYITGSTGNATSLRLEFDSRDIAAPEHLSVTLTGEGTGENGGYTYRDFAEWRLTDEIEEDDLKAPAVEIAAYVREQGGEVKAMEVRAYFEISEHTFNNRLARLPGLGVDYVRKPGKAGYLVARPEATLIPQVQLDIRSDESLALQVGGSKPHNHAGLPSVRHRPEVKQTETAQTPHLQGEKRPEDLALPTGEPDSAPEHAELTHENDGEPAPFEHADNDIDWSTE